MEQDVVEREKKESEVIRSVQIQVKREQAAKEFNRLNELQAEERVLRLKKSLQNRCNGFTTLGRYCLTNTKPAIYWLPANGNAQTEAYLDRSKKAMEEKCAEEKKRIETEIEAVETQRKLREEERKRVVEKMEEEKEEEAPKVDSKMLNLDSESDEEEEEKMEEEKPEDKGDVKEEQEKQEKEKDGIEKKEEPKGEVIEENQPEPKPEQMEVEKTSQS